MPPRSKLPRIAVIRFRSAWRVIGKDLHLGRRISSRRKMDGEYLAGKIPSERHWRRWFCRDRAGRAVSGQWLQSLRHGRQRWEWCSDWYRPDYYAQLGKASSLTINPKGPDTPFDPSDPNEKKRV